MSDLRSFIELFFKRMNPSILCEAFSFSFALDFSAFFSELSQQKSRRTFSPAFSFFV